MNYRILLQDSDRMVQEAEDMADNILAVVSITPAKASQNDTRPGTVLP